MQNQYELSYLDRVLQKTVFTFDVSVWEIFWPLISGSTEVIAKPEGHKETEYLLNLINSNKISVMHFVPSMLNNILHDSGIERGNYSSLRLVITSGEALSDELKNNFYLDISAQLHNLYGPTEASIDVTHFYCNPHGGLSVVPIGTPISNTQIYILNESLNPSPIGVSGEIYIGGAGLARGYLNRPDLTAERFIPNPFIRAGESSRGEKTDSVECAPSLSTSSQNLSVDISESDFIKKSPQADHFEPHSLRLYRTGDLGRYLPDGNIEFLERIDDQVKIRGFRIELGEIESTLNSHSHVSHSVVMAREDEPGDKKLVAYIVPEEAVLSSLALESTLTSSSGEPFAVLKGESLPALTEDLRNHLARSLPDYMVPSFFIYVDKVPLTPNGKIDRKSLPAPDLSLRQIGEAYVAPQTTLEQELCSIWSEVLKVEKIGIHDNFFKLGGHSLLATQVISRIRHVYNIDLPLRALFEHPTVHEL